MMMNKNSLNLDQVNLNLDPTIMREEIDQSDALADNTVNDGLVTLYDPADDESVFNATLNHEDLKIEYPSIDDLVLASNEMDKASTDEPAFIQEKVEAEYALEIEHFSESIEEADPAAKEVELVSDDYPKLEPEMDNNIDQKKYDETIENLLNNEENVFTSDHELDDDEENDQPQTNLENEMKSNAIDDFTNEDQLQNDINEELEILRSHQNVSEATPKISKIGRLLLDLGKITHSDTKRILRVQKKHGLLFGDAALKLGLINDADIQKVVAMQFNYNYLQAGQGKFSQDLVAAYAPFSKKVEAYRALRSQLMMRWFKKGHRTLALVSANHQEGISYLTANLGVVFSQLGARTLIIEANMRTPRQHKIFNLPENIGLSDILVGRSGIEAINEIDSIPDLSVLSAGTIPPNPQELLGRTSFTILMRTLTENYDVILIDTPAAIESADAQTALEIAEGALLVSRLNKTKHDDVLELRNQIEMTGAVIVGAVMNEY
jgi:protein-tyrosine kinase